MRINATTPIAAACPRTGTRLYIRRELLKLAKPIEVACPVCERWHMWDPKTQYLKAQPVRPLNLRAKSSN